MSSFQRGLLWSHLKKPLIHYHNTILILCTASITICSLLLGVFFPLVCSPSIVIKSKVHEGKNPDYFLNIGSSVSRTIQIHCKSSIKILLKQKVDFYVALLDSSYSSCTEICLHFSNSAPRATENKVIYLLSYMKTSQIFEHSYYVPIMNTLSFLLSAVLYSYSSSIFWSPSLGYTPT